MSHTERERPTGPSGSASLPAAVPETLSASNNQSATNLENPDIVDVSFGQETRSSEKDAEEDDEEDPATSPLLNPTPLIATERSSLPSGSDPNAKNILIVTQKIGSTVQRRITNVSDAEIENIGDWSAEEDGSERPNWTSNLLLVPLDQRWTSSLSDQAKIALKSHWHISYAIWDLYQAGSMTYMPVCGTSCWTGYQITFSIRWAPTYYISMAYNAETKASYGVCLVQKVEYIQHPLAALDQLDPSGVLQQHYLFFPSALAFTNSQSLSRKFQEVEERLIKIQSGMKCDDWQTVKHGPQNGVEPDLVELPRRLTSILHGYASDSVVADVLGRIIHFLHEQLRVQKQNPQQYDTMVVDSLLDILAEAEKMQQDMKGRVSYARDVIQSLSQMVYAYRAQRDNELNVRLAKLSHKSNQLNLKLSKIAAHESHMNTIIAKSAVEYSLDMQVISIVTLLFLPGTFMATLFSASFWNFQPGHEGPVASKWGWLYFALTITLTATVFSAWKAYSRWKRTKQLQFKSSIDISALDAIEELTEEDLE